MCNNNVVDSIRNKVHAMERTSCGDYTHYEPFTQEEQDFINVVQDKINNYNSSNGPETLENAEINMADVLDHFCGGNDILEKMGKLSSVMSREETF